MNTKAEEKAKQQEAGSVDIPLSKPLAINGTQVKALRMREPLLADQMAAEAAADGQASTLEVTLFANLCGIAPADLHKIPMRDYKKLQGAYAGFID
jgi:hypothetical protein